MENKKSTVLLTVIAVATLLVAVVGATFAFFTAQNAGRESINAKVTTSTGASSQILVNGSDLQINATQETFTLAGANAVDDTANARIVYQAASDETNPTATTDFCYRVGFELTANDFKYTARAAQANGASVVAAGNTYVDYPELMLEAAYKASASYDTANAGSWPAATDKVGQTGYTAVASGQKYTIAGTPQTMVDPDGGVALATAPATTTGPSAADSTETYTGHSAITGFDLTEYTDTTNVIYFKGADNNDYFKLTATQGESIAQDWAFKLTFVNYNWDQSAITNPYNNAEKTFTGNVVVVPMASCPVVEP